MRVLQDDISPVKLFSMAICPPLHRLLATLTPLLLLIPAAGLAAEASWPPRSGTVTLKTDEFLQVPAPIAAVRSGEKPFVPKQAKGKAPAKPGEVKIVEFDVAK